MHKIIQVLKILGFELCLVRKCSAAKLFFIRRLKVTAEKKYSASIYGHIDKNPVQRLSATAIGLVTRPRYKNSVGVKCSLEVNL